MFLLLGLNFIPSSLPAPLQRCKRVGNGDCGQFITYFCCSFLFRESTPLLQHGVSPIRRQAAAPHKPLQHGFPMGSHIPPANLLQCGILSPWGQPCHLCWVGSDWDKVYLPTAALTVLCCKLESSKGAENTLVFCLQLSSTGTLSVLSSQPSIPPPERWAGYWEGMQPGELTQTDQRDIFHAVWCWHTYKGIEKEEEKEAIHYLQYLTSWETTKPAEVLLPTKVADNTCCWEVQNKIFRVFFLCFCMQHFPLVNCHLNLWVVFHLTLSLLSIWIGRVVEHLGEHLASNQSQSSTSFLVPNTRQDNGSFILSML